MRAIALAWAAALSVVGRPASAERVYVAEGWYQVEAGEGETADSEVVLIVEPTEQPPADRPQERPVTVRAGLPTAEEAIAALDHPDCDEVRGRYLERALELHGVDLFTLEKRDLAVWTRRRPFAGTSFGYGLGLGDPVLAPLYGEPPIPPGALAFDSTLRSLARQLLQCEAAEGAAPARPPVRSESLAPRWRLPPVQTAEGDEPGAATAQP